MKKMLMIPILFFFVYSFTPTMAQVADTCIVKVEVLTDNNGTIVIDTSFQNFDCDLTKVHQILIDLELDSLLEGIDINFDTLLSGNSSNYSFKTICIKTDSCEATTGMSSNMMFLTDSLIKTFSDDVDVDIDVLIEVISDGDIVKVLKENNMDTIIKKNKKKKCIYSDNENVKVIYINNSDTEEFEIETILGEENKAEVYTKVITIDDSGNKTVVVNGEEINISDNNEQVINHTITINEDDNKNMQVFVVTSGIVNIKIDDFSRKEKNKLPEELNINSRNNLKIKNIKYFPNPNKGIFTLSFDLPKNEVAELAIYDMNAKELFRDVTTGETEKYENEIDISNYGKGTYILKVKMGKKMASKKIIVE